MGVSSHYLAFLSGGVAFWKKYGGKYRAAFCESDLLRMGRAGVYFASACFRFVKLYIWTAFGIGSPKVQKERIGAWRGSKHRDTRVF